MKKIAAYTGTRNLYDGMLASVKSLILNSDVDKIFLLIEDDKFPYELPKCVETINVSDQKYFPEDGANIHQHFTYMAYMRAAYPKIFPQYDRLLSLDVDTIIDRDISDIWDLPLGDQYYFSAAREESLCHDGYLSTNTGVALYNLKKLRDGKCDEIIKMVNEVALDCPEQTAMNRLCQGHILEMSSDYNVTKYTLPSDNPKIIHYAGIRNWLKHPEVLEYQRLTFKEIYEAKTSKNSKKQKRRFQTTYMIHTCKKRRWYVDRYLIPSMHEQGINDADIFIWEDKKGNGCLASFMESMKWVGDTQCFLNGIWHLQDDIVLAKDFAEKTRQNDHGIVCGFCNEKFDGGNVNLIGIVPVSYTWFSFPCIRIPNTYARECAEWFYEDVVPNNRHGEFTAEGKHDDALFRLFLVERHPNEVTNNLLINIVDHVDYLIGGSLVNKQRDGIRRAYRFEDKEVVDHLKERLENNGRNRTSGKGGDDRVPVRKVRKRNYVR